MCLWSCARSAPKGTLGGMFGMLKGLVGSKSLSREDMESVLDKMRDHLIGKFGDLMAGHRTRLLS